MATRNRTKAPENPADNTEWREVEKLIPHARNARTHSAEQVADVAESIKEYGWTQRVLLAEDGTIIAGHARVLAAQKLGMKKVPVSIAKGWSEAKIRAYMLVDNKLALNSEWDEKVLLDELEELGKDGYAMQALGFSDAELEALNRSMRAIPPEDFKECDVDIKTDYKCPRCSYEWSGKTS